jgi:hypothetical protein
MHSLVVARPANGFRVSFAPQNGQTGERLTHACLQDGFRTMKDFA